MLSQRFQVDAVGHEEWGLRQTTKTYDRSYGLQREDLDISRDKFKRVV